MMGTRLFLSYTFLVLGGMGANENLYMGTLSYYYYVFVRVFFPFYSILDSLVLIFIPCPQINA